MPSFSAESFENTMTESQATTIESGSADEATRPVIRISRVWWLIRLRWFGAFGMAGMGGVLWLGRDTTSSLCLLSLSILMLMHNAFMWVTIRSARARLPERVLVHLAAQMLVMDMVVWILSMYSTGGMMNPLAVVPVFVAGVTASLLPKNWTKIIIALGGTAIVLVSLAGVYLRGFYLPESVLSGVVNSEWAGEYQGPLTGAFSIAIFVAMILTAHFTDAILTRLRRINRRLVAVNRELSALDVTKSRFLRVSSHQLRGPVAAIHTLVNAIQQVGALSPKQYDLMCKLHTRCDDIIKQLDEMQLLGTIKDKTGEARDLHPVELGSLLAETVGIFDDEATNNDITINLTSPGGIYVAGWDNSLNVVFVNIIGNAVKYTLPGGSVTVTACRVGEYVEVKVADTGIGIPSAQQSRVFKEFFRGTNAQQVCGGTGMGLSIVKEIVDELGGSIVLSSTVGEGTTVTMTLPAAGKKQNITRHKVVSTMKGHINVAADTQQGKV